MIGKKGQALIAVFALAFMFLNYPLIAIADKVKWVRGIPVLYFYLFWIWLILILLFYSLMQKFKGNRD